ncbi:MAG: peptidoglycan DD-metalloendopeptidase family protein [Acidobacteriota bacterium]|nr:peptidoglycan DD-metalloendopeptidase family protein [Acidobacteriota bacterium]
MPGNKHLSIIIVPHTKTNCRTLAFSRRRLRVLIGASILFGVVLSAVLIDYFSMSSLRNRHKQLNIEMAEQSDRLESYESYVKNLKGTIASYENYAKKLNIMAGLKSPDIIGDEAGLGGGGPDSLGEPDPVPAQNLSLAAVQNLAQKASSVENNLGTLVNFFESQAARLASTPTIWPTAGWLSSPFGYRADPFTGKRTFHYGIDIATNHGNPVVATADGIVVRAAFDKMLGNNVVLSHTGGITTTYGHLSRMNVKAGQKVKRGDLIGAIGKTGKALGPHVHYEVKVDGRAVNPYNYILEE